LGKLAQIKNKLIKISEDTSLVDSTLFFNRKPSVNYIGIIAPPNTIGYHVSRADNAKSIYSRGLKQHEEFGSVYFWLSEENAKWFADYKIKNEPKVKAIGTVICKVDLSGIELFVDPESKDMSMWDTSFNKKAFGEAYYTLQDVEPNRILDIYVVKEEIENKTVTSKQKLKQIQPREYLYHKSNPKNRKEIQTHGLEPRLEERSEGYYLGRPAIFATNSNNIDDLFDTTYDDDIWQIDANSGNTWYADPWFDEMEPAKFFHVITFEHISPEYLSIAHEGTGADILEEGNNYYRNKNLKLAQIKSILLKLNSNILDMTNPVDATMNRYDAINEELKKIKENPDIVPHAQERVMELLDERELLIRDLEGIPDLHGIKSSLIKLCGYDEDDDDNPFNHENTNSEEEEEELNQKRLDERHKEFGHPLQTKAIGYNFLNEELHEYPVYLTVIGNNEWHKWFVIVENTPLHEIHLEQLEEYVKGKSDFVVWGEREDGKDKWSITNMDKVAKEAFGLAKYLEGDEEFLRKNLNKKMSLKNIKNTLKELVSGDFINDFPYGDWRDQVRDEDRKAKQRWSEMAKEILEYEGRRELERIENSGQLQELVKHWILEGGAYNTDIEPVYLLLKKML
jgi:hypothetical protein